MRAPIIVAIALLGCTPPPKKAEAVAVVDETPAKVGDSIPELPAKARWTNGDGLTFEKVRGSVVLIDAWHPTCVGCFDSMPAVHVLADSYRDAGLITMGSVAPYDLEDKDGEDDMIRAAIEKHEIPYPCFLDPEAEWSQRAGFDKIPSFMIVGRDGKIVHIYYGKLFIGESPYDELRRHIKNAIAMP